MNVSSVVGITGRSYAHAYAMSKAAERVLSSSVRQELLLEGARGIRVSSVLPAAIDTPIFRHAANYTGRMATPMAPVYSAERVASTIVNLVRVPRREVVVGPMGRALVMQSKVTPGLAERITAWAFVRTHLSDAASVPSGDGKSTSPCPGTNRLAAATTDDGAPRFAGRRQPSLSVAWRRPAGRGGSSDMRAPSYIADFDYATAMVRANARFLDGKAFPATGQPRLLKLPASLANLLPTHGAESAGLPPMERWTELLARAGRQGAFAGVDPTEHPFDLPVYARYDEALKQIPARYPLPPPLTVEQLDGFLDKNGQRSPVTWHTSLSTGSPSVGTSRRPT